MEMLKTRGLYVPTYNGGANLVDGLQSFFTAPDLENESNRLKDELEASLEEF